MMMKKQTKSILILLLIAALAIGSLALYKLSNKPIPPNQVTNPAGTEKIDLTPPSEEVIQETERHKQELSEEHSSSNSALAAGEKQNVVPIIGFLQQASNKNIESNGYISEAVENDGTCTLALERNGLKVTTSKQARPDAQSTVCGLMTIERNKLSPGDWKATLSYSSAKYQGTSAERTIRVE